MTTDRDLFKAHARQLVRKGACPGNLGWVVDSEAYLSKTDKGILQTTHTADGHYIHAWAKRDSNGDWQPIDAPPDNPRDWRKA